MSVHNPPAYLSRIPDPVIASGPKLINYLASHGLERPTLLDLIAERARRARRPVRFRSVVSSAEPLPMYDSRYRDEARCNRERVSSVLDGESLAPAYRDGWADPFGGRAA